MQHTPQLLENDGLKTIYLNKAGGGEWGGGGGGGQKIIGLYKVEGKTLFKSGLENCRSV